LNTFLRHIVRLLTAAVLCVSCVALAASDCAGPSTARNASDQIVDWYDNFVRPFHPAPADAPVTKPTREQVQAYIDEVAPFHNRAVLDPVFFEPLVEQVLASYRNASGFRGIDAATLQKIYKRGGGPPIDFSMLCVSPRTVKTTDDAFGLTLFGVNYADCQHIGLRGLVFTDILVNGSSGGTCRPDHMYYRSVFIPVPAGINDITFVCRRDQTGCTR
jgi:hypothetical protein